MRFYEHKCYKIPISHGWEVQILASDYYKCDHTRATFNIIFQIRDAILQTSASQRFWTKFCPGQCSKLFSLYKDSVIALLHNTEIHAASHCCQYNFTIHSIKPNISPFNHCVELSTNSQCFLKIYLGV